MTWAKIDDRLHGHPKVVSVGLEGMGLWTLALSWCSAYLTDGFIPSAQVVRLGGTEEIASQLVDCGLWNITTGGYQFHDYLEYNPSADHVKQVRVSRAKAGRIGGQISKPPSKREGNTEANEKETQKQNGSKSESETEAKMNPDPDPDPDPDPKPRSQSRRCANAHAPPEKRKEGTKTKKVKKQTPPAVSVFRENTHRYPAKSWYVDIATTVGESSENLELWGNIVKSYVGLGWNPVNVKNMLEFFRRKEIPSANTNNRSKTKPRTEPAGFAGIREFLEEVGEADR